MSVTFMTVSHAGPCLSINVSLPGAVSIAIHVLMRAKYSLRAKSVNTSQGPFSALPAQK